MKKILIVDDEKGLRELLKDTFGLRGFECITAKDGREALKLAKKEHPSVIILDLIMPVMDGFETHKMLKSDKDTKDIPVIVYTAQGGELLSKKDEKSLDDIDILLKPFNTEELISLVDRAVNNPASLHDKLDEPENPPEY